MKHSVFILLRDNRQYFFPGMGIGIVLSALGVAICYFLLFPMALSISQAGRLLLGFEAYQWTSDAYINFVLKYCFALGFGFMLSGFLLFFVKLQILDFIKLASFRWLVMAINLLVGIVLATPEFFMQVILVLLLQLLFEITIGIAYFWAHLKTS
jgi:Sec-independent protein secretion pathway component TatC